MMAGKVWQATTIYRVITQHDLFAVYYEPDYPDHWELDANPASPTINHACYYLAPFYQSDRTWLTWIDLVNMLKQHPDYTALDVAQRAHIEAIYDTREVRRNQQDRDWIQFIQDQKTRLHQTSLPKTEQALIHLALNAVYVILREEKPAFEHIEAAIARLDPDETPYFWCLAHLLLATTHYLLNQQRRWYFQNALDIYAQTEAMARRYNDGYDFCRSAYSMGWVCAEMRELDQAQHHFARGREEAEQTDNRYWLGECLYGMGYIYLLQNHLDDAEASLNEALAIFTTLSYVMTATNLNLIVTIHRRRGELEKAVDRAEDALDNIGTGNPTLQYHLYRQLVSIHVQKRDWLNVLSYLMNVLSLQIKHRFKLH